MTTDRLAYSPRETWTALGIGRNTFWRWAKAGKIKTVKVEGRTLVPAHSLTHLLGEDRMGTGGAAPDSPGRVLPEKTR